MCFTDDRSGAPEVDGQKEIAFKIFKIEALY